MIDLSVKNYQIIKQADISFDAGLNVIIGDSNNGKTALFRAIETALFNLPREGHITAGEDVSMVTLVYNGHSITWQRDRTKASPVSYQIDGKDITKVGRGQLAEVGTLFGIREVDLDTEKIRLNFQKQMSFPFLLDKTASQMFKFIVQGSEQDNLMLVLDDMKKDLSQNKTDTTATEAARDVLGLTKKQEQDKYEQIEPFLQIADDVIKMDAEVNTVVRLEDIVKQIQQAENEIIKLTKLYDEVKLSCEYVDNATQEVSSQVSRIEEIENFVSTLIGYKQEVNSLQESINKVNAKLEFCDIPCVQEEIDTIANMSNLMFELANVLRDGNNNNGLLQNTNTNLQLIEKELSTFDVCPYCGASRTSEKSV